jgi:hypothetical protein
MNEVKLQEKKDEIYSLMKNYIDENGTIDLGAFRKNHGSTYGLIPHYFGSIEKALLELNLVKITPARNRSNKNDISLKDKLSLDMLNLLRETHSFEEIGSKYGVSRALVSQLQKALLKKTQTMTELVGE